MLKGLELLPGIRRAAGGTISLPDPISYSDTQGGVPATASFTLGNNGQASGVSGGTGPFQWGSGIVASEFEVVVSAPSSGAFTGALGAGTFNLGTTRTWRVTRSTIGSAGVTALFEIRRVSDPGTILDSGTLTLTATMNSAPGGGGGGGGEGDPWDNPFGGGENEE